MEGGLRKGCVMLSWLINIYLDGVVCQIKASVLFIGLEILRVNDEGLS